MRENLNLVAGGGFVPQSPIDSVQLADSTMVRNAKKGHKGNLLIQFSFSFRCRTVLRGPGTQHRVILRSQVSDNEATGSLFRGSQDWNSANLFRMLAFRPTRVKTGPET